MKKLPWALLAISAAFNLYLIYLLLDSSLSLDDSRSSITFLEERGELTREILKKYWVGKPADEVGLLAEEMSPKGVVCKKTEEGSFEIGELKFVIKNGVVAKVEYF
ncbi:hypothetical protein SAMN05428989_0537 [Pseudoxanthomonas sp. GM95]|uniref:hypothetical protein n=1 Tax=Pseudoxanthomonas sp. GM95 TaxID=1881043 RepID=UPI0008C3DADB|nr:hypothetical protein [Pseudoxanthomonas sp. GM95]SEK65077.1 hypothetical protein SAMN05428989_0537 [Pseudoxanthomonas sp. GM95]